MHLQHRGQESSRLVVNDDGIFRSYKDVGLVNEVFNAQRLSELGLGNIAIGHVRYGTTGTDKRLNAQPIVVNHIKGRIALAHNGNLTNSFELREALEMAGSIFHTTSDTEVISYLITKERLTSPSIEAAVNLAMAPSAGGLFALHHVPVQNDCSPRPPRFPAPLLRCDGGRQLCGRIRELRAGRGGC